MGCTASTHTYQPDTQQTPSFLNMPVFTDDRGLERLTAQLGLEYSTKELYIFGKDTTPDEQKGIIRDKKYSDIDLTDEGKKGRDIINSFLLPIISGIAEEVKSNINDNEAYEHPKLTDIQDYLNQKEQPFSAAQLGFISAYCRCFQNDLHRLFPENPESGVPLAPYQPNYPADIMMAREMPDSFLHEDPEAYVLTATLPFCLGEPTILLPYYMKEWFSAPSGNAMMADSQQLLPEYDDSYLTAAKNAIDRGDTDKVRVMASGGLRNTDGTSQALLHAVPGPKGYDEDLLEAGGFAYDYIATRVAIIARSQEAPSIG